MERRWETTGGREGKDSLGGGHSELGGISLTATEERATATSRSATDRQPPSPSRFGTVKRTSLTCARPLRLPAAAAAASAVVPRSLARLPSHAQAAGLGQAPPAAALWSESPPVAPPPCLIFVILQ